MGLDEPEVFVRRRGDFVEEIGGHFVSQIIGLFDGGTRRLRKLRKYVRQCLNVLATGDGLLRPRLQARAGNYGTQCPLCRTRRYPCIE